MTIREALEIVLELSTDNALGYHEAVDIDQVAMWEDQQEALELVTVLLEDGDLQ